jgi:hypothetical protein
VQGHFLGDIMANLAKPNDKHGDQCSAMTDEMILRKLNGLVVDLRTTEAELLPYLAQVEARRIYLEKGYSSLYAFCIQALRMGESNAVRYVRASRAAYQYPQLLGLLASGEIHATAVGMISSYLGDDLVVGGGRIQDACGKTKRQLEVLIAAWSDKPVPPVRDSIRVIPASVPAKESGERMLNFGATAASDQVGSKCGAGATGTEEATTQKAGTEYAAGREQTGDRGATSAGSGDAGAGPSRGKSGAGGSASGAGGSASGAATARLGSPALLGTSELKPQRVIIRFEASGTLVERIERAKEVLSQTDKGRSLDALFSEALEALLNKRDPMRKIARQAQRLANKDRGKNGGRDKDPGGKANQRAQDHVVADVVTAEDIAAVADCMAPEEAGEDHEVSGTKVSAARDGCGAEEQSPVTVNANLLTRYIPAPVRDAVVARAEGQCEYVSKDGRRCDGRAYLQADHVPPFALGGQHTVEDLRMLCAAHNRWRAEQTFGRYIKRCDLARHSDGLEVN